MTSNLAVETTYRTANGQAIYDLDPEAAELWAVAGPTGTDPATIDPDSLPPGFRWLEASEWETAQIASN